MEISAIATTAHKIILHIRFSSFHCAFSLFYYKMHFVDNIMLLFIFIIYIYEMMLCRSINSKFSAMFTPLLENICRNIFYSFFSCSSICPILAFLPKAIAVWPSYQHPNMATHKNFPTLPQKKKQRIAASFSLLLFIVL